MTLEYKPTDILITWGPIIFQQFADDSMVVAEFDEDGATKTIGTKGDVAVTVNASKSGKAHVSLLQGSITNALLTALAAQTRPRGSALIKYPFLITDLGGTTLAVGPEAWIMKVPAITYKKGQQAKEWIFDVAEWTKLVNGGARP